MGKTAHRWKRWYRPSQKDISLSKMVGDIQDFP